MKSPIAPLVVLLALVVGACRATSGDSTPTAIPFTTLVQGLGDGELDTAPQGVIRTASGLERLWKELPADAGPAPAIDFGREMVLYANRGVVERVFADSGFLRVELRARTAGLHMVRLARCEAPVQFVPMR